MRQYLAAAAAIPILAVVYVSVMVRRSRMARVGVALGLAGVLGAGILGANGPTGTVARPPTETVSIAAAPELDTTIEVGRSPTAPVSITFGAPMDVASVREMLAVTPDVPVELSWDATATNLSVTPRGTWSPSTFHTITVPAGTLAISGRPTATDIRAVFLTRAATIGTIEPTVTVGETVGLDTEIALSFDRAVLGESLVSAFQIMPPVPGHFEAGGRRGGGDRWSFVPDEPLDPDTTYVVAFGAPVYDVEGGQVALPATTDLVTGTTPSVVRFRPRNKTTDVERSATLSVRFTAAMDRASTEAAWTVHAGEKAIPGKISWAEGDTVLVFKPSSAFGYATRITMRVSAEAVSAAGVPIAANAAGSFTTVPKPAPRTNPAPGGSGGGSGGGGGSVGAGTWGAVETYYLKLMNCTRTGGTVTSTGACSSPGGRNVAALLHR